MIEPDIAIITLVAPAHLQELGGLDGVASEKSRLPAAVSPAGLAIFPRQCAEFTAFHELTVRTMIVEPADVLRPADPPKDRVYFAVTQRGDQTAISLAYGLPPPLLFTLRRVSDGMAQNAALAICAALWLGVARDVIQQRLAEWAPAKWRGEVRREHGRLLYLDCYNANPASMTDALGAFYALAPASEPRLFVLGGMEELGANAEHYHTALGSLLQLRAQDFVYLIGTFAPAVRAAALAHGARADQLEVVTTLEPVAARIETFQGAVFVKGSRRYQLEQALARVAPQEAVHA
jgi:UDP-N-acetylmuramoyl-tripeptide--D-alanyl-D-alanine ligase